jgi:DUF4097 and DUF4098 domain-containing protein YvlB
MSTLSREFTVGDHPEIAVAVASAGVSVVEGEPTTIMVEAKGSDSDLKQLILMQTGDVVTLSTQKGGWRWGGGNLKIKLAVPSNTALGARASSGDIKVLGPVSDVAIEVASGDVHLASFDGRARIKTASGSLTVGSAVGGLQVATASGDVRIDSLDGDLVTSTASGDISIGSAEGTVSVKTASGDVAVRRFSGVHFDGSSMSGDFAIGLAPGMSIDADFQTRSGSFRNLAPAGTGERLINAMIRIKTLSGDITLR